MRRIKRIVEEHFKMDISIVTRELPVVFARACYYKICRDMLGVSYGRIAKTVNKNHATVMHGIKMVNNLIETDRQYKNEYQKLINKFSKYNKIKEQMTINQLLVEYNKLLVMCGRKDKTIKEKEQEIKILEETIYRLADID